jgi:hypothetical protein
MKKAANETAWELCSCPENYVEAANRGGLSGHRIAALDQITTPRGSAKMPYSPAVTTVSEAALLFFAPDTGGFSSEWVTRWRRRPSPYQQDDEYDWSGNHHEKNRQ